MPVKNLSVQVYDFKKLTFNFVKFLKVNFKASKKTALSMVPSMEPQDLVKLKLKMSFAD